MTKSTITRERLEKIKSWRETYGAGSNVMLPAEEAEELARLALAAMDGEPVAYIPESQLDLLKHGVMIEADLSKVQRFDEIPLYRHAQQPTVAGDGRAEFETWMLKRWGRERRDDDFAMGKFIYGEDYADSYTRCVWKAWSASRAAMLHGSQPVSNRDELPVIGWLRSDYNSDDKRDPNAPLFMLGSNDPSEAWGVKYIPLSGNSPVIPDGWVLVPEEPTHEMLEAGDEQFGTYDVYRRMIAAAPQWKVK